MEEFVQGMLCYRSDKPLLVGYMKANMASHLITSRSSSGFVITFACGVVSWQSWLYKCVALSTIEAKFIVTTGDAMGQEVFE